MLHSPTLALVLALGLTAGLAALWIPLARAWRLLQTPDERRVHPGPTPTAGGVPLLAAILGVAWLVGAWPSTPDAVLLVSLLALGLCDDRFELPPLWLLAGQILALGIWALLGGVAPDAWATRLVHAALLLFLINAFNFIDGSDGLAPSLGAAIAAWCFLQTSSLWCALVAGAGAGFLTVNRPPARLFLGNAGSFALGGALGLMLLGPAMPYAAWLALTPIAFDTLYTLLQRARRGEPLTQAHRTHLYQRLLAAGWSARQVTLLELGWFLESALVATLVWSAPWSAWAVAAALQLATGLAVLWWVRRVEARAARAARG